MKAIIMAGGEGSRLRPLTCNMPKPMVRIMDKPVMEYSIELLRRHGITDIGVTLQYMPGEIQNYFGDGSDFDVNITYFTEDRPLGTAGSVKNAEAFLDDTFVVISGDALTDIDLSAAIAYHNDRAAEATLVLSRVDVPLEYGVVVTDEQGGIVRFLEKPGWSEVFSDTVNTGIYILSPSVLSMFAAGMPFDFAKDVFPMLLEQRKTMVGYIAQGYWCDIGDVNAYMNCQYDILNKKVNVSLRANEISPGVWIGADTKVAPTARLFPPVYIGDNVTVGDGTSVEHYCVIGSDVYIGAQASLKRSILAGGVHMSAHSQVRGCVLGEKSVLKMGAAVYEQAIVGDGCSIGENAVVRPAVKIWPNKHIEAGAKVNVNMVWSSGRSRTLFCENGICGEINVDITPELMSRIGACLGALSKGGRFAISRSEEACAAMLQNSAIAGVLSAGCEVYDFGVQLLPITRSAVRFYDLTGGMHISAVCKDGDYHISIRFLDCNGSDIGRSMERKMEQLFEREDFSRCEGEDIKGIVSLHNYKHFYLRDIVGKTKGNCNGERNGYKILVNVESRTAEMLVRQLAEEMGCELLITNMHITSSADSNLQSLTTTVSEGGFDLGAVIDRDCERLILIDEDGKIIGDELFLALTALVSLRSREGTTVVVPVSAPAVIERMAREYRGSVVRTKMASSQIMDSLIAHNAYEQFIMNFDAIGALMKVLDFLRSGKTSLAELESVIGELHIEKREIACPPTAKGAVIRHIMQEVSGAGKVDTTDGVKIFIDNGWVLVLPDAVRPVCRVIAESDDVEFAAELADFYVEKVDRLSKRDGV